MILERGVTLAATGGFGAASIGAIAAGLGMSKSAVFAHFGSKAALDRALLDAAADRVAHSVVQPADGAPQGIARLIALTEAWLAQPAAGPLCLLTLSHEALEPTARAHQRAWLGGWVTALERQFEHAVAMGELAAGADAAQAAFETHALLMAATRGDELGDTQAAARARRAIEALVHRLSAPSDTRSPVR